MPPDPATVVDHPARLEALARRQPHDPKVADALDRLTRLVAQRLSAPLLLLSFVTAERTRIVSGAGSLLQRLGSRDLHHDVTPCSQVIAIGGPVSVTATGVLAGLLPDTPSSYIGVPLRTSDGHVIGALSLVAPDPAPAEAVNALEDSAALAMTILDQCAELGDLRARDELQQTLFRHAPIGQALGTIDGWLLTANPALCAMLGYTEEELLRLHFPTVTHPDDRALTYSYMQRLISGEQPFFDFEKRYLRKDGSVLHVRSTVAIVRDAEGKPLYNIGLMQDISERKQLEAQLIQAQKMESIGQLAGGIAHDFNNLLTIILGYGELAQADLPPDAPAAEALRSILDAGGRAATLTRQLLAFARRTVIEPAIVNLNDLILDMDRLLRRLIGEDIELVTLPTPDLGMVRADPGQIEQVLLNLVVNARDAMPRGGRLTIETGNVELDEHYTERHLGSATGPHVLLAITDTGTGMSPAVQQHLFEPFFTTKAPGTGTGLGLATCYGIVKQHGGSIWVYSEEGHGSTFKIYLPRVEGTVQPVTSTGVTPTLPRGSEMILLVEDEQGVRRLVREILSEHGYTVLEAPNGVEALALIERHPDLAIGLLITDVVMPQMGGREVANRLSAKLPGLRVLFMSGYTTSGIVRGGWLDPGIAFLQKPFTPAALLHKVRAILDGR